MKQLAPTPRRNAFTLVEMLLVLGLMSIIMGFGIAMFTGVFKSSALATSTRQVYGALNLARQMAITKREKVRVVFVFDLPKGHPQYDWRYNAYAIMTNSGYSTWGYAGRWEFLPAGADFTNRSKSALVLPYRYELMPFPHDIGSRHRKGDAEKKRSVTPTSRSSDVGNLAQLYYIEFHPTGASTYPGEDGVVLYDGQPNWKNWANVRVDDLLGSIKIERP